MKAYLDGSARRCWWLLAVEVAGVAILYYGAARLGLTLQLPATNASPVWPPSGIAFAAVLLWGYRVWPGVTIGAFVANLMTLPQTAAGFQASAVIMVGNTLEALVGLYLLQKFAGERPLEHVRGAVVFIAVALVMCLTASTIGPLVLCYVGIVPWEAYSPVWRTWWIGDVAGVLVFTPVLLAWRQLPFYRGWQIAEVLALLCSLSIIGLFIFSGRYTGVPLAYAVIPPLLWAAFRFSRREVSLGVVLVSVTAVWATVQGTGAFARPSLNESLELLQMFIGTIAATMLLLAAVLAEWRRAREELEAFNITLEEQVEARTIELEQRTTQLARSNEELEQFAYVASHDMREPLRKIQAFGEELEYELGDGLTDDAKLYLGSMRNGAARMQVLIADLLSLSRVTTRGGEMVAVDLNATLGQVVSDLAVSIEEAGGGVKVDPLPTIAADPIQMHQLFQNLISNAVKFHPPETPPLVRISAEVSGAGGNRAACRICVEDNGIGFDEKHVAKIFMPFQRLHGRGSAYEGTGIGLAICKKIVDRHHGTIAVRSQTGEGSTFTISLPASQEESP